MASHSGVMRSLINGRNYLCSTEFKVKVRAQEEPVPMQKEDTSYIVRVIDIESLSLESHSSRILVPTHASRRENGSLLPHARISKSHLKDVLTPSIATPKGKNNNRSNDDNKTKSNGFGKDNRCQTDPHLPRARNSRSHPKNSLTPSTVASKGKNNNVFEEDNKMNIRAGSVPRPRAVLSSPDNDEIIGSQNQQTRVKQTPLGRPALSSYHKSDAVTGRKNQLTRENRTITRWQILSPKTEGPTKLSCRKPESPCSSGKVRGAGISSIAKGKHSSEPSAPRQRPPFKVG